MRRLYYKVFYGNHPLNINFIKEIFGRKHYGKLNLLHWRMVAYFYTWLRFIINRQDFDINEDYICGDCGKPVFRRMLTCSKECWNRYEANIEQISKENQNEF